MDELASDSARSSTSPRRGLASKLIVRVIVVSLVPLLLVGAIAVFAVLSLADQADREVRESGDLLADDVVATQLQGEAAGIISEVERFVDERIGDAVDLAATTEVLDAAEAGSAEANSLGIVGIDPAQVEAQVPAHSLAVSPTLDAALAAKVADSAFVGSILVTDQYGNTAASSAPTAEVFVGDEAWWTDAFDTGGSVSPFRFDATANLFAVDVAVPVSNSSATIGVLRMSIDVSYIQDLADALAVRSGSDVSIVNAEGLLLADTATGHDLTRIMNAELTLDPAADADIIQSQADTAAAGSFRTGTGIVGFARSTASDIGSAVNLLVVLDQDEQVALAPLSGLDALRDDLKSASRNLMLVLLTLTVAAIIASFVVARVLVRTIVRPIVALRDAANRVADVELPRVMEEIEHQEEGAEPPSLQPIELDTGDEVEELARAFTSVQDTAVRLASVQAEARRRNVAQAFVSMGRRNQNLIGRQLEFIEQLEQSESDPQTLANLFKLDHLATRLRRNAESLLVLAGEEPARRWGVPVSIIDVVRSAASEIEDFPRVELSRLEDQPVQGSVVAELSHLLAEVVENALAFSPPNTTVLVAGRRRPEGYELAVVDRGIGMTASELEEANERLASPAEFDRAPTQRLGLFVVGRLAARHGIRVKMVPSAIGQGVTVLLLLPPTLLEAGYHPDSTPTTAAAPTGVTPEPETASMAPTSLEAAPAFHPPIVDQPNAFEPRAVESPQAYVPPSFEPPAYEPQGSAPQTFEPQTFEPPAVEQSQPFESPAQDPAAYEPHTHEPNAFEPAFAETAPDAPMTEVRVDTDTRSSLEDTDTPSSLDDSGNPPALPHPDGSHSSDTSTERGGSPWGTESEASPPQLPRRESATSFDAAPPSIEPASAGLPRREGAGVAWGETASPVPPVPNVPVPTAEVPAPSRSDDGPDVTPSGLRRRRSTEPLPVAPARPLATIDEMGPERDPDAVRATLRRFMTGVGHGRRLAGDSEAPDPISTGGGHDE